MCAVNEAFLYSLPSNETAAPSQFVDSKRPLCLRFLSAVLLKSIIWSLSSHSQSITATMSKSKNEDIANLDIVEKYETYEDYLDSQLTSNDMGYLEDEEMARQLVELGYRGLGDTIRREVRRCVNHFVHFASCVCCNTHYVPLSFLHAHLSHILAEISTGFRNT